LFSSLLIFKLFYLLFKFDETNVWRGDPSKQRRSCEVKNVLGEMKKTKGEKQKWAVKFMNFD